MRVLCSPLGLGMQANASRASMGRVDVLDFALGCPGVRACAKTTAWVAAGMPVLHHFTAPIDGVCNTHSSAAGSYVAVVCSPRTFEPCASSVCA